MGTVACGWKFEWGIGYWKILEYHLLKYELQKGKWWLYTGEKGQMATKLGNKS